MKVTASTYSELSKWASAFADKGIQAMVVYGDPGLGKTRTIASVVGESARVLTGEVSAIELYRELWRHRDIPFVIDDVDQLLKDRQMVKLLKSVCQTEDVKTVGWHTTSHLLAAESIPTEFQTSSRVAVLLNEYKPTNLNVKAIEDRGVAIHFNPSAAEVHAQVGTWFADEEVYSFIGFNLKLVPKPSMRMYVTASQIRQAGVDWRQALLDTWDVSPGISLLLKLASEPFASEEERAKAFVERGGGSRATYFRNKKRVSHTLAG